MSRQLSRPTFNDWTREVLDAMGVNMSAGVRMVTIQFDAERLVTATLETFPPPEVVEAVVAPLREGAVQFVAVEPEPVPPPPLEERERQFREDVGERFDRILGRLRSETAALGHHFAMETAAAQERDRRWFSRAAAELERSPFIDFFCRETEEWLNRTYPAEPAVSRWPEVVRRDAPAHG